MIADLQSGSTDSTIAEVEKFLTASLQIQTIEEEILAFAYSVEQIKTIGSYAIRNYLYSFGANAASPNYNAQYASASAYQDSETPTDIDEVVFDFEDLVDIVLEALSPAEDVGRSSSKNILFNQITIKKKFRLLSIISLVLTVGHTILLLMNS